LAQGKRAPQAAAATGFRKHLTAIDGGAFGGSNSSLAAPGVKSAAPVSVRGQLITSGAPGDARGSGAQRTADAAPGRGKRSRETKTRDRMSKTS
jgi:bifunctional UDP-N-acetylglucosamine pyrophosphorylase / glucosamine-1-phosphate N-acetyltransferase